MKVVVTGLGLISPLGNSPGEAFANIKEDRSGIAKFPEWSSINGQNCLIGGPAADYDVTHLPRSVRRTMSRMSEMSYLATKQALEHASLSLPNVEDDSRVLICIGSTMGSPDTLHDFYKKYFERGGPEGQLSTGFFKTMNHTTAANVAMALGFSGPLLSPSVACATSTQAMILGWELLQTGMYDIVIAGGADEIHPNSAAVFVVVRAVSLGHNDSPEESPRPFDTHRDGLVVSEGAGVVVLETETHAKKRNAHMLTELKGGAYLCDGKHMSLAQAPSMARAIELGLKRSGTSASDVDYVNAHATGTVIGDTQEARAVANVFGSKMPVSSLKGHFGHTLAACGAIEVAMSIAMMDDQILVGTHNLKDPDPECNCVDLVQGTREVKVKTVLSNNFAFGGINSCLVLSSI